MDEIVGVRKNGVLYKQNIRMVHKRHRDTAGKA